MRCNLKNRRLESPQLIMRIPHLKAYYINIDILRLNSIIHIQTYPAVSDNQTRDTKMLTFLDVVVGESTAILKLLPGKNEPLLIRGNTYTIENI